MKAEEVLSNLIDIVTLNLNELITCDVNDLFIYGEMTAYVECLELLQSWEKSKYHGLNFKIADKYKI